jgi:Ca2+-binding EF-hand superfamily protein
MWKAHLRGEETSLNPLSMMEALIGAMQHSAKLAGGNDEMIEFATRLQKAIHAQMVDHGTRDLDQNGLTTEQFVEAVAKRLNKSQKEAYVRAENKLDPRKYDDEAMNRLFEEFDIDGSGSINPKEFAFALKKLGVAPLVQEEVQSISEKKPKF